VAELQRIESLLNDYKAELSDKYSMIMNDWQGEAGAAFDESGQKVLDDFEINIETLGRLATVIEQAGQFMQAVDQDLANAINDSGNKG